MKKHMDKGYVLIAVVFLVLCLIFNVDSLTSVLKRDYRFTLRHIVEILYALMVVLLIFLLYFCEKNICWPKIWLIDVAVCVIILWVSSYGKTYLQMFPNIYVALTYAVLAAKHLLFPRKQ